MTHPDALTIDDSKVQWSRQDGGDRPLVVLLHGRGSNEADLMGLVPHLDPEWDYVALRAPLDFPGGGFTWFPTAEPGRPDPTAVERASRGILTWLEEAAPGRRAAVLGFSQGGALALSVMRLAPERFAGYVNLSGFLASASDPADARLTELRPPVFWGRDVADPVIPVEATDATEAWLPEHSTLTRRRYAGIGHSVSYEEILDVKEFLSGVFAS